MNKSSSYKRNTQKIRNSYTSQSSSKLKKKVRLNNPIKIVQPKQNNPNDLTFTIFLKKTQPKQVHLAQGTSMEQAKKILLQKCDSKQMKSAKKIIGFETIQNNYILDYKLQQGLGKALQAMNLRPIYQSLQTGINSYKVCQCLSTGGFSKVFLIRCLKTGKFFAGKYIDKKLMSTEEKKQLIKNQIQVNQQLSHCFLTKMHQFIESDNFYILVLDYCPGGELFYLLRRHRKFSEHQARFYIIQILLGIQYMHQNGIVYRDLKPENIMIDKIGHVKIADFGLAKHCNKRGRLYSYCGSLQYMAPEILSPKGHSFQVDYYCIGALLFQLLIGCPPFYSPSLSQQQTKYHILNTDVVFPQETYLSDQVKDLITKLLQKDAKKRLGSLGSVKEIFCHRWFGNINKTKKQYLQKNVSVPFPTDLGSLNFDQKQIGVSQQRFARKIQYQMRNQSSKEKHQPNNLRSQSLKKQHFLKNLRKSLSQSKKTFCSPYRFRSNYSINKNNKVLRHKTEQIENCSFKNENKGVMLGTKKDKENVNEKYLKKLTRQFKKHSQGKLKKLYSTLKQNDTSKFYKSKWINQKELTK